MNAKSNNNTKYLFNYVQIDLLLKIFSENSAFFGEFSRKNGKTEKTEKVRFFRQKKSWLE